MVPPMLADIYFGYDDWKVFFACIVITSFFGGSLALGNMGGQSHVSTREAFLLLNSGWLCVTLFAALPFWFSSLGMSFTDSFFEAASGITTTGSTVIVGLDYAPAGILLWRAMLQWLGGIGIIMMGIIILPFLRIGGMQIFNMNMSNDEKSIPQSLHLGISIAVVYAGLTLACSVCYMLSGMEVFDSVAHAMSTVSTGGFSTFDQSFNRFQNNWMEITAIVFMIGGAIPFLIYLKALNGDVSAFWKNSQVRWFISIVAFLSLLTLIFLYTQHNIPFGRALRHAIFNMTSIMTGTGFVNGDPLGWGIFSSSILFFAMFIGGCSGSTTCGIKIFRFQILYEIMRVQMRRLVHPNGVFVAFYEGRPVPPDVPGSVMSFFFVYALTFVMISIALAATGLDFITSMSGAATSISNVGPGLGNLIGGNNTFKFLPDAAKWILSFGMLLGRLEISVFLVLLSPYFWKR